MIIEILNPFSDYCDDCPLFERERHCCRLPGKHWAAQWVDQAYPKNFLRPQECKELYD
jgi:hypothetical protein